MTLKNDSSCTKDDCLSDDRLISIMTQNLLQNRLGLENNYNNYNAEFQTPNKNGKGLQLNIDELNKSSNKKTNKT
jgi:hypothetical protein